MRTRDYKAEYQRRIELAKERANTVGKPFDRSEARGHSINRAAELARGSIKQDEWRSIKEQTIEEMGKTKALKIFRMKRKAILANRRGDKGPGQALREYLSELDDEYELDEALSYYHEK
jgi:hypothetical protein